MFCPSERDEPGVWNLEESGERCRSSVSLPVSLVCWCWRLGCIEEGRWRRSLWSIVEGVREDPAAGVRLQIRESNLEIGTRRAEGEERICSQPICLSRRSGLWVVRGWLLELRAGIKKQVGGGDQVRRERSVGTTVDEGRGQEKGKRCSAAELWG